MQPPVDCPSVRSLESLASGQEVEPVVSAHLASCERCRRVVQAMRSQMALLEELREALRDDDVSPAVRDRLLEICLRAEGEGSG